ncbi:MAG: aldo/keto reductase [Gemmatimonadales bacterium]|nr:MAG: aldo/keto reductase [Gemmatimonadales bacterium]
MMNRREWLKLTAAAGTALSLPPVLLKSLGSDLFRQDLIMREIPSTGELVPLVGLGSSATFAAVARSEDVTAIREVLSVMMEHGGRVFDTAPSYGASEEVTGEIANELGIQDDVFWATKVNVAGRGGGPADPDEARAQIERSFARFNVEQIDLIQVHNLGDPPTQLGILREYKEEGRIRYLGITSTSEARYDDLAAVMRNEPLDFIGVDYAVDNRSAEELILPLARDRGIGVLVYAPFGRTRLWNRVEGRDVPGWARAFDAESWAQFFIKFIAAHPAVTAITPSTSRPHHMIDNLGGARGRIPNQDEVERMIRYVDDLPPA